MALASETSLEVVLERIVSLAVDITGATYGALGVLADDGRIVEFITHGVTPEQRAAIGDPPTGHGILGVLIREGRALRISEISRDPRSVGFPANHPPMHSFLGAPIVARGYVFGRIYLTEKRGGAEFEEEDERTLIVLAAQAGVAIENARLHEESARRQRWLEAAHEVGELVMSGTAPREALARIAELACELAGADVATIATPGPTPGELRIDVAAGSEAMELHGRSFPLAESIWGAVMRSGRTEIVVDLREDPRGTIPIGGVGGFGPAAFVPLVGADEAFGTLMVANRGRDRPFDEERVRLVETFASQAAIALAFDRANRERERLALLEDRERIAKELHDGVIQSLFAVGMGLQGTAALAKDEDIGGRIESAVEEIDRAIRDLRNYIFGLRPGILADRQLDQALRDLVEEFSIRTDVVTVVDVDEEVAAELSGRAGDVVQFVREALSNVGRHAAATTCRVSLRRGSNGEAVLEVDDDGRGFDPADATEGMGLANLRERARALNGSIRVDSRPGDGTVVRALLPT